MTVPSKTPELVDATRLLRRAPGSLCDDRPDRETFPLFHLAVAGVVVGHERPDEVARNLALLRLAIPPALWADLKDDGLLPIQAPTPD